MASLPAQSVLKQSPQQTTAGETRDANEAERHRRHLGVALHHANKIQQRKDVEQQILLAIEAFIDYPQSVDASARATETFTHLTRIFQPSDFEDLVEERRIDGRCGYALCPKSPRIKASAPGWKHSEKALNYCSTACARQSAHVKSQLSPIPAWERPAGGHPVITLEQGKSQEVSKVAAELQRLKAVDEQDLALERGENPHSLRPKQVITDTIVEKAAVVHKPLSSLEKATVSCTAIEGYEPKRKSASGSSKREVDRDDSSDDDALGDGTRAAYEAETRGEQDDYEEEWNDFYAHLKQRNVAALETKG